MVSQKITQEKIVVFLQAKYVSSWIMKLIFLSQPRLSYRADNVWIVASTSGLKESVIGLDQQGGSLAFDTLLFSYSCLDQVDLPCVALSLQPLEEDGPE